MKDFYVTDYKFSPGVSGAGYIELFGIQDFDITRLVSVINQTKGAIIYATALVDKRYTAVSGKQVFFNVDTSSHSSTDKLQIIYNSSSALATSADNTDNLIKMLSRLVKIMENQQSCDGQQRQRIVVDSGSLTSVGTMSTLSTVTNIASMSGMGQEQYINIARNTYANSIRSKLSF